MVNPSESIFWTAAFRPDLYRRLYLFSYVHLPPRPPTKPTAKCRPQKPALTRLNSANFWIVKRLKCVSFIGLFTFYLPASVILVDIGVVCIYFALRASTALSVLLSSTKNVCKSSSSPVVFHSSLNLWQNQPQLSEPALQGWKALPSFRVQLFLTFHCEAETTADARTHSCGATRDNPKASQTNARHLVPWHTLQNPIKIAFRLKTVCTRLFVVLQLVFGPASGNKGPLSSRRPRLQKHRNCCHN